MPLKTKKLQVIGQFGSALPSVSTDDNEKVLKVVDGKWQACDASLTPTSAVPIDSRIYFDSLALAKAAAATAAEVGNTSTVYYIGQKLFVREGGTGDPKWYIIQPNGTLIEEGVGTGTDTSFTTDETLVLKEGVLSVNVTNVVEKDNTLPVTSGAVYAQVGAIENLLDTI